jgi:N-methylhydantoinase B
MTEMKQAEGTRSPDGVPWDGWVQAYRPDPDWMKNIAPDVRLHKKATDEIDPVTHEVIRHRLWMINEAHGATTVRISGSPVISYTLDFNMSILTQDAEIVYNAPYIQHMNSAAPLAIKWILENLSAAPGIHEGDMFLCNDPWIGACHQLDVLIVCPVFWEGEIFAWVGNTANQYDLGGITPGSWVQDAVDIYYDPVPMPPFKMVEKGVMRKDLERMYLRHSRMPKLVALDLRAAIAGCNFARDGILGLINEYGAETVKASMQKIISDAQKAFIAKLQKIPDGRWSEVFYFDEKLPGDRSIYRVQVNLTKEGDRLIVDNEGTSLQTEGPNGITYVGFQGSVVGALPATMVYDQLFAMGGALRQIDIKPTPGTLTCTNYPAAASAGIMNVLVHMRGILTCVDRMMACDPELKQDIIAPSPDWPLILIAGVDDRGNPFGTAILDPMGSGLGACSYKDGVDTGGLQWNPMGIVANVEASEQVWPIVYLYRKELADSGGAGRWRGGVGAAIGVIPYRTSAIQLGTATGGSGVSLYSAEGLFGAYPAPTSRYLLKKETNIAQLFQDRRVPADIRDLEASESLILRGKSKGTVQQEGDVYDCRWVGGGGYGDPLEREPWRVANDVSLGYVSTEAARDIYGVVVGKDSTLDEKSTASVRSQLLAERASWKAPVGADPAADVPVKPATGAAPRPVHECLEVRDDGKVRVIACSKCSAVLCGYSDNYKRYCKWDESSITKISPLVSDPSYFVDDPVVFRRFCCPGCNVLLATEVVHAAEPPVWDMRLF